MSKYLRRQDLHRCPDGSRELFPELLEKPIVLWRGRCQVLKEPLVRGFIHRWAKSNGRYK